MISYLDRRNELCYTETNKSERRGHCEKNDDCCYEYDRDVHVWHVHVFSCGFFQCAFCHVKSRAKLCLLCVMWEASLEASLF